ncbi:hypothetical protein, variant [Puccinia triticina 1-1 BBBD Race 1]|nr:hypothetical protein, variant [Puccinia triticina 1-1 BBBD Race 1]
MKSDFKNLAHRVRDLMLTEANISQTLSNLVETSHSNERELTNEIIDDFGETLEQAAKVNANIHELQRRIKVLNGRMKKKKEEFINELASQKAKNAEEMAEFKEQLSIEAASLPAKIQAAKSTKAEQKQVQLKLAKILADGLP